MEGEPYFHFKISAFDSTGGWFPLCTYPTTKRGSLAIKQQKKIRSGKARVSNSAYAVCNCSIVPRYTGVCVSTHVGVREVCVPSPRRASEILQNAQTPARKV